MQGPLKGIRVLEFGAIGPGPLAAMLLSDLGADVLRIDRPGQRASVRQVPNRGRPSLILDLKNDRDVQTALALVEKADVLIEGFRPGVMERIGLGPDVAMKRNPRLVFGRITGWGQDGPLAQAAGHDINYIALTGALDAIGSPGGTPVPPLNLVGDYGGGTMYLIMGIMAALLERERSGLGQVVDAAIVDGVTSLMAMFHWLDADGIMPVQRDQNYLTGSAPFYGCYRCADGKYIAVGANEQGFFEELTRRIGLDPANFPNRFDPTTWPEARARFAEVFSTRTQAEWVALLEGKDACFAPVIPMNEAIKHPHIKERQTLLNIDGLVQPAVAPRFSRTPGAIQSQPCVSGIGGAERAMAWGVTLGVQGSAEAPPAIAPDVSR